MPLSQLTLRDVAEIALFILVLVAVVYFALRRGAPETAPVATPGKFVVRAHNKTGASMLAIFVNGHEVVARRNPTPAGRTYEVPLAKHGRTTNIAIIVYGADLHVDSAHYDGASVRTRFVYTGELPDAMKNTTVGMRPALPPVADGDWAQSGVYIFIP